MVDLSPLAGAWCCSEPTFEVLYLSNIKKKKTQIIIEVDLSKYHLM